MSIGIYPVFTPQPPKPPRDWSKVNLMAPLYGVMTKHRITLKQLYFLVYETHRMSGKIGRMRSAIMKSIGKKSFGTDREFWQKFKEWLKEVM